jgi:hypothetical protein
MKLLYQLIICLWLTGLAWNSSAKAEGSATCEEDAINNCSCALPIMESQLSPAEIALLIHVWTHIQLEPAQQQSKFFREHSAKLLSVSLRYTEVKYVIAMQCGDLAYRDE